jgi:preprotein translocase subunit SecA
MASVFDDPDVLGTQPYRERSDRKVFVLDRHLTAFAGGVRARLTPRRVLEGRFIRTVERIGAELSGVDDAALKARAQALRPAFLRAGLGDNRLVAEAMACLRESTLRSLGIRHRPNQIYGALLMVRGSLLEMATGEGKTVTALLAAGTAAFAGRRVHVVTVNDYLARRDREELAPVYERLGITTALVLEEDDPDERRAAYRADVVYVNNKSVTFDYLRDRMALGQRPSRARNRVGAGFGRPGQVAGKAPLTLSGLDFAIVDEADSVLIDEAKTPLIISAEEPSGEEAAHLQVALGAAALLKPDVDFRHDAKARHVELTEAGKRAVDAALGHLGGLWSVKRAREARIAQALSALHVFQLDEHYIIADGKVQIVDEFTGRVMPDRSWEGGLQQMIEAKEGLELSNARKTIARITYQRFFRRYRHLCGMTGTAMEVSGEIRAEFDMAVRPVPTHAKGLRRFIGTTLLARSDRRWEIVAERAAGIVAQGRSVLVGVRSVAASEALAAELDRRGMPHRILNARQDAEEATIVSEAGQPGRITVATNMAGRGTDIKLAPAVRAAGGLHVILTEFHESARVDRQLFGRCARQGDPGTTEAIVSLEDDLFVRYGGGTAKLMRACAKRLRLQRLPGSAAAVLRHIAQTKAEWENAMVRYHNLVQDREAEKSIGFVGLTE